MKNTLLALALMTMTAQSFAASACFKNNDRIASVTLSKSSALIKWDIKDKSNSSTERGDHVTNYVSRNGTTSGQVYLQGSGDGSEAIITITPTEVRFQGVWGDGSLMEADIFPVVNCR